MLKVSKAPSHKASSVVSLNSIRQHPTTMPGCANIVVGEALRSRPAEGGIPEAVLLGPVPAVDNLVVDRTDPVVGRRIAAGLVEGHRSLLVVGRIVPVVGLHNLDPEVDHRSLLVERIELTRPSYRMMSRYYRATI